ncbi:MAG: hypothetical protein DRI81_17040 [Chloroflexi bacterium]|nr:MAG: hypothetical protein DRI81_17040 [Chloroflexota bacterium]
MKEPIIFRRDDCLSHEQAMYWKDLLYRTVKVGTEVEFAMPKGVKKDDFLLPLVERLQPTRDLTNLGQYGVLDIISEHCGLEVQIIGRQPYYPALMEQYRAILDPLVERGVRARATCGLHYHTLTIGLSEPTPEIVLANVWNLTRRYAPYLRFLTSGGDCSEALCRRRNYTSHLEMVRHTPGVYSMREIYQLLHASKRVPEHQNFLNLEHVTFTDDGEVRDFHIEFRFPDADLAPSSIVAKTFLFLAVLLKAVEMSQYGVIHVGRVREWRRKVELLDMLSNNEGNLATSDTSGVTPEVIDELRTGCRELLELLKPVFVRFARVGYEGSEDHPAFEVLSLLAETPLSLLRASGRDWIEIEQLLSERAAVTSTEWDKSDRRLIRVIELAELTDHAAPEAWKWETARELFLTPQELERRLERLDDWRGLKWDTELGTMIFLG